MQRLDRFTEKEIPYEDLAQFGLTQEMIDDLPQSVMTRLLSGYETPLLPLNRKTVDDVDAESYARLQLVRNSDNSVSVAYLTRWETNELEKYTPEQRQTLLEGKVTVASIPGKGQCFIQYDDAIQQVMAIPVSIIRHNVNIMASETGLSRADYGKLMNGEVVEKNGNTEVFSMGVDLNDVMGIRLARGGAEEWREEAKAERLPRYNFGIYGCWMADETGTMKYVSEDDYTEEMEAEYQRMAGQHAATAQMNSMGVHL